MHPLSVFLNHDIARSTEIITDFSEKITATSFAKNQVILRPGQRCNDLYFIVSGLVRASYFKDGKDISCHFSKETEVFTAIDAFFQQSTTKYQLQALEETQTIKISYKDLHEMFDKHPAFNSYGRELITEQYGVLVERINHLQFLTAKERYQNFEESNSDLFQRVSLGHIASFLGITQETLSRIRNQN